MVFTRCAVAGLSTLFLGVPLLSRSESVDASIDGKAAKYQFLDHSQKRWRLCAVLPHAHDRYFWAVAYGLNEQAKVLGVDLGISEAGGYERLSEQKRLIRQCVSDKADAVLIAAINPTALDDELELLTRKRIKIIDLVNGLERKSVMAHSHQDFSEAGHLAARYVLKTSKDQPIKVAWFPGQKDALWAVAFNAAVRETLTAERRKINPLILIDGGWGAPYIGEQSGLVRRVAKQGRIDIILANAPAAEFAARFYSSNPSSPKIVSLYATDGVVSEMRKGTISAMVANSPVVEAKVAVDLAIRLLENMQTPRLVSIPLRLVTSDEIESYVMEASSAPVNVRMPLPKLPPY